MEVNKIGILDFFSAFRTDVTQEAKRYDMSDLKAKDWELVSKKVKDELTINSQERIKGIINGLNAKIKNLFTKNQIDNNNYSSEKTTNAIQKTEVKEENIK